MNTPLSQSSPATVLPLSTRKRPFRIALPQRAADLDQDEEWCVVDVNGTWQEIRFHDYAEIYDVPGLYERLFHGLLECTSPRVVTEALAATLMQRDVDPDDLSVFDLGAGNGMVGQQLRERIGPQTLVGADILESARAACERDRPGLYTEYVVEDLTRPSESVQRRLASYRFNAMTCVAALGFGDIPCEAFATALALVERGGLVAFNIKEDFVNVFDCTGFGKFVRHLVGDGILEVQSQRRYQHRLAVSGDPLYYMAVVATKAKPLPIEVTGRR